MPFGTGADFQILDFELTSAREVYSRCGRSIACVALVGLKIN